MDWESTSYMVPLNTEFIIDDQLRDAAGALDSGGIAKIPASLDYCTPSVYTVQFTNPHAAYTTISDNSLVALPDLIGYVGNRSFEIKFMDGGVEAFKRTVNLEILAPCQEMLWHDIDLTAYPF